ncbi:copper transport protein [Paenibacillus castaneae]|uniref:CopD family protein n=1 Tax=Paenibacillus castaneae TaxID=474957 RepID=UPI000C9B063D|nr:CopD family protein [Paenibacillus castaneae]NIK76138.1 copper transport protein [Paenibacillus castaneae]
MRSFLHKKINPQFSLKERLTAILTGLMLLILLAVSSMLLIPQCALAQSHSTIEVNAAAVEEHAGHKHSTAAHEDTGITVGQALFYAARVLYYVTFILAVGFMLWSVALSEGSNDIQRGFVHQWSLLALRAFLLAVLLFVFVNLSSLLKNDDGGSMNGWIRLLLESEYGYSLLGVTVLSLLGFVIHKCNNVFKWIWALLLAAAESFNGHIYSLPDHTLALLLDFIHITASAYLAGGLVLLLLFWYVDRKEAGRFAERYTRIAWLSLVVLAVSGIGMTILLLPSWLYLIYTSWGIMLLVKAVLVLLVAGVGTLLHRRAKKRELPSGMLVKLNGLLICFIVIIVSVFTYVKPSPAMKPFSYHKMSSFLHYTLSITPNGPGPNQIMLKVWLPEQLGAPETVKLQLRSESNPKLAGIDVPLQSAFFKDKEKLSFPGFTETGYLAAKVELPLRGAWTASLIIIDHSGVEIRQSIAFRND